jgi:hypothetical protein
VSQEIPHWEPVGRPLFPVECNACGETVMVSVHTQQFREVGRGPMLAYYGAPRDNGSTLAGVSDGSPGSFECLGCHSKKWAKDNLK